MISQDDKLARTKNIGYKPIEKKQTKKKKCSEGCFDYDDQKLWLFPDDPGYQKTRKSKKKK